MTKDFWGERHKYKKQITSLFLFCLSPEQEFPQVGASPIGFSVLFYLPGRMIGQMIVVKKLEVANFKVAHLNLLRVSTVHHVDYGIDASAVPFPH